MTSPRVLDPNTFASPELDLERLPELVGSGLAGADDGPLKSAAFDTRRWPQLRPRRLRSFS